MQSRKRQEEKERLSEVLAQVAAHKERVVVRRNGRELAAVIPLRDLRRLERLERQAAEDRADVRAARQALREPGTIPWEKVKRQLGL
jgi:prevent-host-death family protein